MLLNFCLVAEILRPSATRSGTISCLTHNQTSAEYAKRSEKCGVDALRRRETAKLFSDPLAYCTCPSLHRDSYSRQRQRVDLILIQLISFPYMPLFTSTPNLIPPLHTLIQSHPPSTLPHKHLLQKPLPGQPSRGLHKNTCLNPPPLHRPPQIENSIPTRPLLSHKVIQLVRHNCRCYEQLVDTRGRHGGGCGYEFVGCGDGGG